MTSILPEGITPRERRLLWTIFMTALNFRRESSHLDSKTLEICEKLLEGPFKILEEYGLWGGDNTAKALNSFMAGGDFRETPLKTKVEILQSELGVTATALSLAFVKTLQALHPDKDVRSMFAAEIERTDQICEHLGEPGATLKSVLKNISSPYNFPLLSPRAAGRFRINPIYGTGRPAMPAITNQAVARPV